MSRYALLTGYLTGLRPGFGSCIAAYGFIALLVLVAALSRFALDGYTLPALRVFYGGLLLTAAATLLSTRKPAAWYSALFATLFLPLLGLQAPDQQVDLWNFTTKASGVGFVSILAGTLATLPCDPNVYHRSFGEDARPPRWILALPLLLLAIGFGLLPQSDHGIGTAIVLAVALWCVEPIRGCARAALRGKPDPVTERKNTEQPQDDGGAAGPDPRAAAMSRAKLTDAEREHVHFDQTRVQHWLMVLAPIGLMMIVISLALWLGR